jgi:adenylosuccinate synthase
MLRLSSAFRASRVSRAMATTTTTLRAPRALAVTAAATEQQHGQGTGSHWGALAATAFAALTAYGAVLAHPHERERARAHAQGMQRGKVDVVLGSQWGDEGKGKLVDVLASRYALCVRSGGGSNAGHTIVRNGVKVATHLLPTGVLLPGVTGVLGNGMVISVEDLLKELRDVADTCSRHQDANDFARGLDGVESRLKISDSAHIVFSWHKAADRGSEKAAGANKIGTTQKGIGPCYTCKAARYGVRMGDLRDWSHFVERVRRQAAWMQQSNPGLEVDVEGEIEYFRQLRARLLPMVVDASALVNETLRSGQNVLVEGANALMLDMDFGTYPFVTSSNPSVGGVCTGAGIPPSVIRQVIGVVKAYTTRVGEGKFVTEEFAEAGKHMCSIGREVGTTTGRVRRCGWLDLVQMGYSTMVNGYTEINLTKLDVLTGLPEIKVCVGYHDRSGKPLLSMPHSAHELDGVVPVYVTFPGWKEDISKCRTRADLPTNARLYVEFVERVLGVRITSIGVGPDNEDMILEH